MKFYLLRSIYVSLLAVLTLHTGNASAQTIGGGPVITPGSEDCRIRYSYDAAGNRIKREYKCVIGSSPIDNVPINTGTLNVYPNPTTGVFHVGFSEVVAQASFIIYASDGSVVQTYQLMQPSVMVTFDITAQVPGAYFLTVWALNRQEETYTIIKIQ